MPSYHGTTNLRSSLWKCTRRILLLFFVLLPVTTAYGGDQFAKTHWYKGTTHSHSFWSDGDQFPDMVVDWFKSHGYDFFCLTDHNRLMQGDRWLKLARKKRPVPEKVFRKYLDRFGDSWVEVRGEGKDREVRLKTFAEIKSKMGEPGKFLLIQGEEITDRTGAKKSKSIHLNALNLVKLIRPCHAGTPVELMRRDIQAAEQQAKRKNRPIFTHINHPNFARYPITARMLAELPEVRCIEICNNHNGVKHYGDKNHPSVERLWDIANTIRLAEKKGPAILGVATDDSHNYQKKNPKRANPGRGWIFVRATELSTNALLDAMARGDFYSSTGVELAKADYDPEQKTLSIEVVPKPDTHYTIEFIGTPAKVTLPKKDTDMNKMPEIGKVLASHEGTSATYRLTGDELYVRALVRSDRRMKNPSETGVQNEQAWTQPVGWKK